MRVLVDGQIQARTHPLGHFLIFCVQDMGSPIVHFDHFSSINHFLSLTRMVDNKSADGEAIIKVVAV